MALALGMTEVEVRVTKATVAIHVMQALPHHLLLLEKPLVSDQKVQVALRKRETARAGVCISSAARRIHTPWIWSPAHTPYTPLTHSLHKLKRRAYRWDRRYRGSSQSAKVPPRESVC